MAHRDRPRPPLFRVRRLPRATIAAATERRLAGDWQGACAAAGMTVDIDLGLVAKVFGANAVDRLIADLSDLAPDLLGQYLPGSHGVWSSRYGVVALTHETAIPRGLHKVRLSGPDRPVLAVIGRRPSGQPGAHLLVTRRALLDRYGGALPVWCWRADAAEQRRIAYGEPQWQARIEAQDIASGIVGADDVHPLVHDALFPGRTQLPPAYAWSWEPVPVRCGTDWHEVRLTGGRLVAPSHTGLSREPDSNGSGEPATGCANVLRAWRTGYGWLPRRLRWLRADFFGVAARGHGDAIAAALDAGFDITVTSAEGASLVHYLPWVGLDLLPALLAAGMPVDQPDKQGRTPLHWAYAGGVPQVIQALLDAGADPAYPDSVGRPPQAYSTRLDITLADRLHLKPEPRLRSLLGRAVRRGWG